MDLWTNAFVTNKIVADG